MGAKRQRAIAKREKRRSVRARVKSRARRDFNQRVRVGFATNRLPAELLPVSSRETCTCGHPFGRHYLKVDWPCCSDCEGCRGFRLGGSELPGKISSDPAPRPRSNAKGHLT